MFFHASVNFDILGFLASNKVFLLTENTQNTPLTVEQFIYLHL